VPREQRDRKKIALNWIESVKKGKFKEKKPKQRKTEKGEEISKCMEEKVLNDSESSDDENCVNEKEKFQSVAVTFIDGKMEAFKPD
jgi:hypothetical protein